MLLILFVKRETVGPGVSPWPTHGEDLTRPLREQQDQLKILRL